MAGAAGDDALAILAADDESGLLEAGDYGYAGCVHGNAVGDAAIGGGHKFVKDFMGCFDTAIEFGFISRMGVRADEGGQQDKGQ